MKNAKMNHKEAIVKLIEEVNYPNKPGAAEIDEQVALHLEEYEVKDFNELEDESKYSVVFGILQELNMVFQVEAYLPLEEIVDMLNTVFADKIKIELLELDEYPIHKDEESFHIKLRINDHVIDGEFKIDSVKEVALRINEIVEEDYNYTFGIFDTQYDTFGFILIPTKFYDEGQKGEEFSFNTLLADFAFFKD